MNPQAQQVSLEPILPFRAQYLTATHCQIRYDACHARGWTDSYLLLDGKVPVGYGSIKGLEDLKARDTIFEFFLIPSYRKWASVYFEVLLKESKVKYLEAQSNDPFMHTMLFAFGEAISSDVWLFEDHYASHLSQPAVEFRLRKPGELAWAKPEADCGHYVLVLEEKVVADGSFLLHYNHPFADMHMEVHPDFRGQGLAAYILQEIKKECYLAGRVPAARCNRSNPASRGALLKAGMRVCGWMLQGKVQGKFLP